MIEVVVGHLILKGVVREIVEEIADGKSETDDG